MESIKTYAALMKGVAKRTNNPFNIKYSKENKWLGQCEPKVSDNGFCHFITVGHGLRAGIKLIYRYIFNYGLLDIVSVLERFSPRSDNVKVFDNKVMYVTKQVGLHPINTYFGFISLCQSIVSTECGVTFPSRFFENLVNSLELKFVDNYGR